MASDATTVFILGAGASQSAGAPLMDDFLDKAQDLLAAGKVKDEKDKQCFQAVFAGTYGLHEVFAKSWLEPENLESVFAAFEMAELLGIRLCDFAEPLTKAIRRLITVTLEESIEFPIRDQQFRAPVHYGHFAAWVRELAKGESGPISLITFNYDTCLDYALVWAKVVHGYCLDSNPAVPRVRLLKLHGSIHWAKHPNEDLIFPLPWPYPPERLILDPSCQPQAWPAPYSPHFKRGEYDGQQIEDEPVIVPPTWNKGQHHQAIRSVWRQAAQDLAHAQRIFVIGYSLPVTDHFFRYLYALGTMGAARLRHFHVLDPAASDMPLGGEPQTELEKRYARLLGPLARRRFKTTKGEFRNAPDTFMEYLK